MDEPQAKQSPMTGGSPGAAAGSARIWAVLVAAAFLLAAGTVRSAAQGTSFYTVTPCRLLDTRGVAGPLGAPSLAAGASRSLPVAGQCGVSTRAAAISANITVISPPSAGYFSFGPSGGGAPTTSTLNFRPGLTRANNAILAVGAAGAIDVFAHHHTGTVDLVIDIDGYFADPNLEQTTVAPPAFTPPPGSFTGPQQMQILTSTPGAQIFFTLDGSTPTSSHGTLYTGAFMLTQSAQLRAVAVSTGLADSPVTSGQYSLTLTPTLFLAAMTPQSAALSLGSGSASLLLAADGATAVLHFTYSNLTGPITNEHIHGPGGLILFDIDTSQPDATGGRLWTLTTVGTLSVADQLAALRAGQCYINLHTAAYPAGEIKGFFNAAAGSLTFIPPAASPALPPPPVTQTDAARFLMQAAYGPAASAEVSNLAADPRGFGPWLTNQFAQPLVSHLAYLDAARAAGQDIFSDQVMESFWQQAITGPDQLRQRVALALSEIMVVSDQNSSVVPDGLANYLDILERDAFGNYRQLLTDVTLDPTMGVYLNMLGNDVGDPANGINPNENYAREILQLFSVGLYKLNPDGTLMLDATGLPIPTYNQEVVKGFAQIFTGWTFAGGDHSDPNNFFFVNENWRAPMEEWPEHHSPGTKLLLDGAMLPAGQTPRQDLDAALNLIFQHPNVGPFICRELIQRLVTSNPSPAYVYRCGQAFANDGHGVRGNMQAVLGAILQDYEARSTSFVNQPGYGHLREPIVRLGAFLRALHATSPDGKFHIFDTSDPEFGLDQNPLRSPTVFNFFEPTYVQPGTLAQAGLVAPEFKITNETTVFATANYMRNAIFSGAGDDGNNPILPDLSNLVGLADAGLLDYLNLMLMANGMSSQTRTILQQALADPNFSDPNDPTVRVNNLLWLIVMSPEFTVQH